MFKEIGVVQKAVLLGILAPTFLATGMDFLEDNFSTHRGDMRGGSSEMI